MKKFTVIMAVLLAAFFFVSCGGDENDDAEGASCDVEGAYQCSGNTIIISQKCQDGTWTNFQQCNDGCNQATGKCNEPGGDTGSGDTGSTDTGDTGTGDTGTGDSGSDTGDTAGGTDTCADIYQCSTNCADQACLEACIANGTPTDQNLFVTMYNCWGNNCANASTSDEFTDCIAANCLNETEACGLNVPKQGDTTYSAPYGTAQVNVASTYILTNETQIDGSMVNMSSYVSGNLGSSSIVPANAQLSYYYAALVQDGGQQYFQIVQNYAADAQGQQAIPFGVFIILPANAAPGTVHFGLDQESVGQMFVVDFNGNQVGCYHGFGYGDLTLTAANAAAGAAGNVSLSGSIEIYSAANAPMYGGDITSHLNGWVNCAVR